MEETFADAKAGFPRSFFSQALQLSVQTRIIATPPIRGIPIINSKRSFTQPMSVFYLTLLTGAAPLNTFHLSAFSNTPIGFTIASHKKSAAV